MGILKDWADKGKAAAKKFSVRFSRDGAASSDQLIVPPTEAVLASQGSGSTPKVRSRSGSSISASSLPSVSSDESFLELKLEEGQGSSSSNIPQPDKTVQTILSKLRQTFDSVDHFRGRISQKNIHLTNQHKEVFNFIMSRLEGGELVNNGVLSAQSPREIVEHFANQWTQQHPFVPNPSPQAAYTWNPMVLAGRGLQYGFNSAASLFVTPAAPRAPAANIITADFIQYLLELFQNPLECISRDANTNLKGKLNRWPQGLKTSPPGLGFSIGGKRASEVVLLEPCVRVLGAYYATARNDFDEDYFRENYLDFFSGACLALHTYYRELKKLNSYLVSNTNNMYLWRQPTVQEALDYYFEQGKYLYEIHSMLQNEPLDIRNQKIALMREYGDYIKSMYAREEVYTRKKGPLYFGWDKWTKIEAAMEQYRYLRGLPGDIYPRPSPEKRELVRFAGEQGRLKDYKAKGLNFYGQEEDMEDPFVPLNMPTRLKRIPL